MTARKRRMAISKAKRKAISTRIRQLRGDTTQVAFAAEIGTTQQNLSRYEKGLVLPSTEGLFAMAASKKVSIDWLLFGKGGMWLE